MNRRKNWQQKYTGKYEKDLIITTSLINKIEVQNQEVCEKLKTVFYCTIQNKETMCIVWGRTTFGAGDEITMTGRINENNVFLVWKYLYQRREQ